VVISLLKAERPPHSTPPFFQALDTAGLLHASHQMPSDSVSCDVGC
jgi:hypothetical protein